MDAQIACFFVYSIIAHLLSVLVIYISPTSTRLVLHDYVVFISIENTGFSYREFTSLLVLKCLGSGSLGLSILSFAMLLLVAIGVIFLTNIFIIVFCSKSTYAVGNEEKSTFSHIRNLNSEAFALSLGFALTLVLTDAIYPLTYADYLVYGDDTTAPGNSDALNDWLFLAYSLSVTILVSLIQTTLSPAAKLPLHSHANPNPNPHSKLPLHPHALTSGTGDNRNHEEEEEKEEEEGSQEASCYEKLRDSCSLCLFWYDRKGFARSALGHFFNTFAGYTVGCAWYALSVLAWQEFFYNIPAGRIFGLFLYAVIVTLVVLKLLTYLSVREEKILQTGGKARRNAGLFMITSKLLVGWSWSAFIIEAFSSIPVRSSSRVALGALTKGLVALMAFAAGALIAMYWRRELPDAHDEVGDIDVEEREQLSLSRSAGLSEPLL